VDPPALCAVAGNVDQWTANCYHNSDSGAPSNGAAWTVGDYESRIVRGDNWKNVRYLRSAVRFFGSDEDDELGFRVSRTLPP
jgi:formylglycine-generating enzyme required for sulfatase activity